MLTSLRGEPTRWLSALWWVVIGGLLAGGVVNLAVRRQGGSSGAEGAAVAGRPAAQAADAAAACRALIRDEPRRLQPTSDFRGDVDRQALGRILDLVRPRSPKPSMVSILVATHALRLWGPAAPFERRPEPLEGCDFPMFQFSAGELLEMLLVHDAYREMYPHARPFLTKTGYGITTRPHVGSFMDVEIPVRSWPDGEYHVDKLISVLAEVGIGSGHPVQAADGEGTVRDLVVDSMVRFSLDQELEFTARAYLGYLELPARWTNRFGQEVGVDELLAELAGRPPGEGACVGTHVLQALATALRFDEQSPFLAEATRARVAGRLRAACRALETLQLADGSWPAAWYGGGERVRLADVEGETTTQLRVAGHHLEWIAIAPAEARPSPACIRRAIGFVTRYLIEMSPSSYYYHYPLCTHAARALVLLAGSEPYGLCSEASIAAADE